MPAMEPIVIVDYGAGNLRSVQKAFEHLGHAAAIADDPDTVAKAPAIVFPGQGACPPAMATLNRHGMADALRQAVRSGTPFFGVCLGLQLLFDWSEEGDMPGLGIIPGRVVRLPRGPRVPHMGWNEVRLARSHPVFEGVPDESLFYFVHSYHAVPSRPESVVATTDHGIAFCSVAARDNVIATQFHPEKSGPLGLRLYDNFVRCVVSSPRGGTRVSH
ncbi:MAG: imidazole glycerol phosphate synthase subunit HisH [SAR202 cluster bacterium]|nr:imidazole glycerol phosphate synthase subunit HisH [SAR202 cluster bacterium]